jgi:hypothetical protein
VIDYTFNENKGCSTSTNPKRKAHCIANKTFVVIDDSLVKRLSIDDETWFEQEATDVGILLKVCHNSNGDLKEHGIVEEVVKENGC